jgi:predicted nucleic acid-binding protein
MRGIFVDSWGWIASLDRNDSAHAAAQSVLEQAGRDRVTLVTTNAIVYECSVLLRRWAGHRTALALLDRLVSTPSSAQAVTVVRVDEAIEHAAIAIFCRYDDKDFSFVDCLSFAVMQQRGIETALTGDRHFAQMGSRTVPPIQD